MKQLIAFTKKEWIELIRTGKFLILIILFLLFGIMNPAIAKLTPWMMEAFSESFEEVGIVIKEMEVNAFTSWTQFYKNIPIALIVFIVMFSSSLTAEYQKGTLINMLTKGLCRWKIIISKTVTSIVLWTICYWFCYGITYAYNAYFWDNSIASHLLFSAFCVYFIGIWLISILVLMSTLFQTTTSVLVGTGGIFGIIYILSLIPKLQTYLPTQLWNASSLLTGSGKPSDYIIALWVTGIFSILALTMAIVHFNTKQL